MVVRATSAARARCGGAGRSLPPRYVAVARAIVHNQGIELVSVPYDPASGQTRVDALNNLGRRSLRRPGDPAANFFGVLEPVDALTDWAHQQGMPAIAVLNSTAAHCSRRPADGAARAPTSASATASRWARRSPRAAPISAS